jgi:Tfp pilus assembly protein PilE
MSSAIFAKYGIQALLVLAITGGLSVTAYSGYRHIYNKGEQAATAKCQQRIQEYEANLLSRIDSIEQNSTTIIQQNEELKESAAKDFQAIIKATKGRPLYTIQAGACAPSADFIKAYNDAIMRANKE